MRRLPDLDEGLILGVDPGLSRVGWGVIDGSGSTPRLVEFGHIATRASSAHTDRLLGIYETLGEVITRFKPATMAIEEVFLARDAKAAIKLGQARGAAIVACVNQGMPVHEYAAKSIKQAVVGTGSAEKGQVQHMVKSLLRLPAAPAEDAADALAAALCHAHTQQYLVRRARSRRR